MLDVKNIYVLDFFEFLFLPLICYLDNDIKSLVNMMI